MNFSSRSKITWIVFDVDGVLVDPSESYDRAVKYTAEEFLRRMGIQATVKLDQVRKLRVKGAFGDDFDVSEALVLGAQLSDLETFVETFPERENVHWVRKRVSIQIDRDQLVRYFNTVYLGRYYPDRLFECEGLWKNEKPLVKSELLRQIESRFQIGVVTGRNRLELELAEKIIGYYFKNAITRNEALKPDPRALELLCNTGAGIYVGDTVNDGILVEKYNRRRRKELFRFVMIGRDVDSVNDFLSSLL